MRKYTQFRITAFGLAPIASETTAVRKGPRDVLCMTADQHSAEPVTPHEERHLRHSPSRRVQAPSPSQNPGMPFGRRQRSVILIVPLLVIGTPKNADQQKKKKKIWNTKMRLKTDGTKNLLFMQVGDGEENGMDKLQEGESYV